MNAFEILAVLAFVLSLANAAVLVTLIRADRDELASGTSHGLPLGAALPSFRAIARDGSTVTERDAQGLLFLFLGESCHACHDLAMELRASEPGAIPRLLVGVLDRATGTDGVLDLLDFASPKAIFVDPDREIAGRLGVPGTPFVYAIDQAGRVRAKQPAVSSARLHRLERFTHAT